jgi:hypothetical protein
MAMLGPGMLGPGGSRSRWSHGTTLGGARLLRAALDATEMHASGPTRGEKTAGSFFLTCERGANYPYPVIHVALCELKIVFERQALLASAGDGRWAKAERSRRIGWREGPPQ